MPLVPADATRVATDSRHVRADDDDVGGARARVVWMVAGGSGSARPAPLSMNESIAAQLFVRIDPRAREPLQAQVCDSIRRAILDGVLHPGTRLPSSRALAADLGISRTTTVLAFDQLAAEGYLTAKLGSGT
jgi:hypothetical protein